MKHTTLDGYQQLANAIIITAANDYRRARKRHYNGTCECIKKFFYSEFFDVLSPVSPEVLLQKLDAEYNFTKKNRGYK